MDGELSFFYFEYVKTYEEITTLMLFVNNLDFKMKNTIMDSSTTDILNCQFHIFINIIDCLHPLKIIFENEMNVIISLKLFYD